MIQIDNFTFYNADCLEIMKTFADKQFDLAIVDPPYGININHNMGRRKNDKHSGHKKVKWDSNIPTEEYFNELFRVSKNQIIWGANYFHMRPTKCFIVWKKPQISEKMSFSMCEYAWASFDSTAKVYDLYSCENKIHPTQKPVDLYDFLLKNYAKNGQSILDTHLGSASIALAVDKANKLDNMNLSLTGIELDSDYFNAAIERFRKNRTPAVLPFFLD